MSLTKNDKEAIQQIVKKEVSDNNTKLLGFINTTFAKQSDLIDVKNQLSKIDVLMSKMDRLIGMFLKSQEESNLLSSKVYDDLEPRVKALEK